MTQGKQKTPSTCKALDNKNVMKKENAMQIFYDDASELIGDAFQHWGNGRVLLDMGTGRGKNEFIIKKLVSWRVDEMLKKRP